MSSTTARVLSGYRRLFRARKSLFTGDIRAMRESRIAIRAQFEQNRHVQDPQHLEGLIVMIDEAEDMLLHGIVRGELNEDKNAYEVKIKKEHASSMDAKNMSNLEPITSETGSNNNESKDPKNIIVEKTHANGCQSNR